MTRPYVKTATEAFTLIELLVIVLIAGLIAVFLSPGLVRARRQPGVTCSNNLKQVGLAVRVWNLDSSDFAMKTSTNYGGTRELIGTGQVFIHFRVMSNELSTPKVLVCPRDKTKTLAKDFTSGFSDKNVSYFVSTDAAETYPNVFLSGDRNLAFQGQPIKPGLFVLTSNNASLTWTKAIHHSCGNVCLADGSVQPYVSKQLATAVQNQGVDTNLLAIP
jgi:competence protein ComGC